MNNLIIEILIIFCGIFLFLEFFKNKKDFEEKDKKAIEKIKERLKNEKIDDIIDDLNNNLFS